MKLWNLACVLLPCCNMQISKILGQLTETESNCTLGLDHSFSNLDFSPFKSHKMCVKCSHFHHFHRNMWRPSWMGRTCLNSPWSIFPFTFFSLGWEVRQLEQSWIYSALGNFHVYPIFTTTNLMGGRYCLTLTEHLPVSLGLSKCSLWIIPLTLKRKNFIAGNLRLRGCIYLPKTTQQMVLELESKRWQASSRACAHSHRYPGRTGMVPPFCRWRNWGQKKDYSLDKTASNQALRYIF